MNLTGRAMSNPEAYGQHRRTLSQAVKISPNICQVVTDAVTKMLEIFADGANGPYRLEVLNTVQIGDSLLITAVAVDENGRG